VLANRARVLKAPQLRDASVCNRVRMRVADHGITEEQLSVKPPSSRADYLRAYRHIDIALDPFPYPGGATSFEALQNGAP